MKVKVTAPNGEILVDRTVDPDQAEAIIRKAIPLGIIPGDATRIQDAINRGIREQSYSTKTVDEMKYRSVTESLTQMVVKNPNLSNQQKRDILERTRRDDALVNELRSMEGTDLDTGAVREQLSQLTGADYQKRVKEIRQQLHRLSRKKQEIAKVESELADRRDRETRIVSLFNAWLNTSPWRMERPHGVNGQELRSSLARGDLAVAILIKEKREDDRAEFYRALEESLDHSSAFIVEHDWAAAFDKAEDFDGGEWKLPDDTCTFEFRINGMPVVCVAFAGDDERSLAMLPSFKTRKGWFTNGTVIMNPSGQMLQWYSGKGVAGRASEGSLVPFADTDRMADLFKLFARQIKAIAVALEAEVATAETVRAEYKRNRPANERRALPAYSYHVVSLARRTRAAALPVDGDHETGSRRRLHFRRGHWRHYDDHKTWIKWMLVGDPDLGFVDKHYKL